MNTQQHSPEYPSKHVFANARCDDGLLKGVKVNSRYVHSIPRTRYVLNGMGGRTLSDVFSYAIWLVSQRATHSATRRIPEHLEHRATFDPHMQRHPQWHTNRDVGGRHKTPPTTERAPTTKVMLGNLIRTQYNKHETCLDWWNRPLTGLKPQPRSSHPAPVALWRDGVLIFTLYLSDVAPSLNDTYMRYSHTQPSWLFTFKSTRLTFDHTLHTPRIHLARFALTATMVSPPIASGVTSNRTVRIISGYTTLVASLTKPQHVAHIYIYIVYEYIYERSIWIYLKESTLDEHSDSLRLQTPLLSVSKVVDVKRFWLIWWACPGNL